MTAKVINDPAALGWEFDPDTGRWTWGGSEGGSNGGGGTPFPEAPINGLQYGRQNAGWTEIVGGGAVTTASVILTNPQRAGLDTQEDANQYFYESLQAGGDVDLTNYYTKPESDDRFQVKGNYLTEFTEEDPTVPAHVKSITTSDINKWNNPPTGGGGGAVDSVNGKTGTVVLNYSDVGAQVAGSYATASHNHSGVYQPAGSYATANHNHSGVYQPVGNYATTSYAYSKSQSDGKYALKGASATWDGQFSGTFAEFKTTDTVSGLRVTGPNAALRLRVKSGDGKHIRVSGNRFDILSDNYATNLFNVGDDSKCYATDFIASSDRNLKHDIETAPTGVIEKLRGVTFKWNDTGKESSGVIAQELQEAGLGHLVSENTGTKSLSVSYSGLTAYLIEEIKALKAEIEEIKNGN
jgi:hypothetical protein